MPLPLLDTNVFLRHLLGDHPDHSPKATAYLMRIEQGKVKARTSETVIFETVYTLQKSHKTPKPVIRNILLPLIELPGIVLPSKRRIRQTFDLFVDFNLPFADAYHVVLIRQLKLIEIVTFDQEFDRFPDIARVEPY
jgi:predicted nucleic acid-binding protein